MSKIWVKDGYVPNYFEGTAYAYKNGYKILDKRTNTEYIIDKKIISKIEIEDSVFKK